MTTSGTYSITLTVGTIIDMVLQELGILGASQSAKSADSEYVKRKMNLWLLQQNGPNNPFRTGDMMWTRESATLTLSTSKSSYDLKPSGGDLNIQIPSEILSVTWRDASDDTDLPLTAMTLIEYTSINDKSSPGQPQRYYYERRTDTGKLYLDYLPDSADELIIYYKQPLEIITASTETFDLDPSWYRSLLYSVAKECAGAFGIGIDSPIYQGIAMNAAEAMMITNSFFSNNHTINFRPGR